MLSQQVRRALLLTLLVWTVGTSTTAAQSVFRSPGTNNQFGGLTSLDNIQSTRIDSNLFLINGLSSDANTPLQTPSGSISKLDRKAPAPARREYEKGYQLLMKKDLEAAIAHLAKSIEVYPSFVAAHNALGTAYMSRGQNQQAREEFARAVALDDHLPNSYLNLGCAQLALQQYSDAEESLKKASSIAPLDLPLRTALTYAEFVNHDYPAVLETARQVHAGKHEGAAMVHYFAAGALEAQDNLSGAQAEMETLLKEDPKSPSAAAFRQILDQIKAEQVSRAAAKEHAAPAVRSSSSPVLQRTNG